ncbi:hypothetical protein O9929_08615 [Vibrio lentus]|nr:hypothetical protein [Vibrio lentus]
MASFNTIMVSAVLEHKSWILLQIFAADHTPLLQIVCGSFQSFHYPLFTSNFGAVLSTAMKPNYAQTEK